MKVALSTISAIRPLRRPEKSKNGLKGNLFFFLKCLTPIFGKKLRGLFIVCHSLAPKFKKNGCTLWQDYLTTVSQNSSEGTVLCRQTVTFGTEGSLEKFVPRSKL